MTMKGMTKTNSTAQGGRRSTSRASVTLSVPRGMRSTTRATMGSRWSHSLASSRNSSARMTQSVRSQRHMVKYYSLRPTQLSRLRPHPSAVHVQRLPGDKGGVVAGEERHRADQVFRQLGALDRLHLGDRGVFLIHCLLYTSPSPRD